MTASRKTALVVGVLFILTFITSIAGELAYGPVLTNHTYITGVGADTRVLLGAFFELFLIVTNIGCAVVLFPLLKRQNEAIALGYVAIRLVECIFIMVGILSVLAVVTLRQSAPGADAGSLITIGKSLIVIKNWAWLLGPGFMDGIGTGLMLGWLMYGPAWHRGAWRCWASSAARSSPCRGSSCSLASSGQDLRCRASRQSRRSSGRATSPCGSPSKASASRRLTPARPPMSEQAQRLRSMRWLPRNCRSARKSAEPGFGRASPM